MPVRSEYTDALNAIIDAFAPDAPVQSTITAEQITSIDSQGKTRITLNWLSPVQTSIIEEFIGTATGGSQVLEVSGEPIVSGSLTVVEVSTFGGGGAGDTTLSSAADRGSNSIEVNDVSNFAIDDFIRLEDGAIIEYATISAIEGNFLILDGQLINEFTIGSDVEEVTLSSTKSEGIDYTVNLSNGEITLIAGQFTSSNEVVARHRIESVDVDEFEVYRSETLSTKLEKQDILALGDVVIVDDSITSTSILDELDVTSNGRTIYYYLFARDLASNISIARVINVETIPASVTSVTHESSPNSVVVKWTALSAINVNADGLNVYRAEGPVFDRTNLLQLNASLLDPSIIQFKDNAEGSLDGSRVPPSAVPFPVDGLTYFYLVETQDTTTDWVTGTTNQTSTSSFNGVATK